MEPEGSLPHSQVPASCPYTQAARSSPCLHIPLSENPSYYYPPIYVWVSPFVSFPQISPIRTLCTPRPCPIRATCPAQIILLHFTTGTIFGKEYRSLTSSLCDRVYINPSVWSIEHCSSTRKLHLSWSNERCSFAALSYSFDYISTT